MEIKVEDLLLEIAELKLQLSKALARIEELEKENKKLKAEDAISEFPENVTHNAQYGANIKGLILNLNVYHCLPYKRLTELLADTKLVLEVLNNSFDSNLNTKRILHSDRGSQFRSLEYKSALEKLNITHSMSRIGKCIDNGPMEGLFGNIKVEKYYLKKYTTLSELEKVEMV